MKRDDLMTFQDKHIRIRLKSGYIYTCFIEKLNDSSVHIKDKFQEQHVFAINEIVEISEVRK